MGSPHGNLSLIERKKTACDLYQQEIPVTHIAEKLGVSRDSIYLYLKEAGIRRSIQDKTKFKNYISHQALQKISGTNKKNILRAVQRAEVSCVRVGTHVRYRREDVPKILESLNADRQPEFLEIDPLDAAWLGGFFDGEGHVGIHSGKNPLGKDGIQFTAQAVLVNTDKSIMEAVSIILSSLSIRHNLIDGGKTSEGKTIWRIALTSAREIAMFCRALIPTTTGHQKERLQIMFEWALRRISLGKGITKVRELYVEYAKRLGEVYYE